MDMPTEDDDDLPDEQVNDAKSDLDEDEAIGEVEDEA